MEKVLFINGQRSGVGGILKDLASEGYCVECAAYGAPEEEKRKALEDAVYLVLHPAVAPGGMLRGAKSLKGISINPSFVRMHRHFAGPRIFQVPNFRDLKNWYTGSVPRLRTK